MKNILMLPGLVLLLIGCNRTQGDDKATGDTEKSDPSEAIWIYDYNQQTEEFETKQLRSVDRDTLAGETLEKIINISWPKVQIKFIRTSNDTAFISIPDSEVLTQQMGSAGAESFMISTTFSFTELKGINYVSFDFKEGDHGIPGVYNRNSWDMNKNP
ncbi:MAG: hypothetical protein R6W31_10950 [Bacteroidales bacterium]